MATNSSTPNILLIIADDLGESNINVSGSGAARTMVVRTIDANGVDIVGALPNISRLLRGGLHFPSAWAHPACSTTRASIYTGLHPWKNGVGSPNGSDLYPSRNFATLPNRLPDTYVSGLFGKWHLGRNPENYPTAHGWDKHVGTLGGANPDHFTWTLDDSSDYNNSDVVSFSEDPSNYYTLRTAKEAAGWINSLKPAIPWFATVAFNTPHSPFHVPPGGYDTATAGKPESIDPVNPDPDHYHYMFNLMMQNTDYNIGRLLGTPVRAGGLPYFDPIAADQLSNTIIIFISDNGSPYEATLEEEKTEVYEGGVRVPVIFADGQTVMNGINGKISKPRFLHSSRLNTSTREMFHVIDLYTTIVRLANPGFNALAIKSDSADFSGLLKSAPQTPPTTPTSLTKEGALPTIARPLRTFNFAQIYDEDTQLATLRNAAYKLNYDSTAAPQYSLFKYDRNDRIPA